jgi:hypothetical protein
MQCFGQSDEKGSKNELVQGLSESGQQFAAYQEFVIIHQ